MANQGKRMVKENLIAKIGQGGSGTEYTAGVGIGIDANNEITANIKAGSGIVVDTDLTDDSLVIMTDDDLIQSKLTAGTGIDITTNTISVDSNYVTPSYGIQPTYEELQGFADVAAVMAAGCPILSTADAETDYPDNVVTIDKGIEFNVNGLVAMKKQSGTGYVFFYVADLSGLNVITYTKNTAQKTTGRIFQVKGVRYRAVDQFTFGDVVRLTNANNGDVAMSAETADLSYDGVRSTNLFVQVSHPTMNTRYDQQPTVPTVDGTYTLKVTVASGTPTISWELDQ